MQDHEYIMGVLQKLKDIKMEASFGSGKEQRLLPVSMITVVPKSDHPNWNKTVGAMKYIIDHGWDHANGFDIEFNSSFTKFRKSTYTKPKSNATNSKTAASGVRV